MSQLQLSIKARLSVKKRGLTLGPELVTDGAFTNTANWGEGAGWAVTGGQAVGTATSAFNFQSAAGITAGRTYRITFTISGYSAGSVQAYVGATAAFTTARSSNGTFTEDVVATSTNEIGLLGSSFTGNVDDLSVKELS